MVQLRELPEMPSLSSLLRLEGECYNMNTAPLPPSEGSTPCCFQELQIIASFDFS